MKGNEFIIYIHLVICGNYAYLKKSDIIVLVHVNICWTCICHWQLELRLCINSSHAVSDWYWKLNPKLRRIKIFLREN